MKLRVENATTTPEESYQLFDSVPLDFSTSHITKAAMVSLLGLVNKRTDKKVKFALADEGGRTNCLQIFVKADSHIER